MKKITSFVLISFIFLSLVFASSSQSLSGYQDNLFFSYNPRNTLDKSIYGYTFETPSPTVLAGEDINAIKYADPSSNQTFIIESNTNGTMDATFSNGKDNKPLNVYVKIFSPWSFTFKIEGTNLSPSGKSGESTLYIPVTYKLGPLDYEHTQGAPEKLNPPEQTAGTGVTDKPQTAVVYSVDIPIMGASRKSLGYWFCGPLSIIAKNFVVDKGGSWTGSVTMTLTIN